MQNHFCVPSYAYATTCESGLLPRMPMQVFKVCMYSYAPVLRSLRPLSQTHVFRTPPLNLISRRLQEVCRWEGLKADLRALSVLTELAEGDMRVSLNTLQFLKRKTLKGSSEGGVTVERIRSAGVGRKDIGGGFWTVMEGIFWKGDSRKGGLLLLTEVLLHSHKPDDYNRC